MLLQKSMSVTLVIVLVFSIILGACSGTPGTSPSTNNSSSSQSPQTASRQKLFVFLSGFTSVLSTSDVAGNSGYGSDPDFFGNGHIQPYLQDKFPGSYFLVYSYHGFTSDGKPLPYTCPLTIDSDIADLAVGLRSQISQFLRSHANIDVYVIGHSLGGVIAFSFLAQMIEGNNNLLNSLPNGGALKGVFTLDSPVGGVTGDWLYQLAATYVIFHNANCNGANILGKPIVKELNDLYNSATSPEARGETASVDATITLLNQKKNQDVASDAMQNGVKVSTFGNSSDVLWQPSLCHNPITDFLRTQWLSEVQSGINAQGGAVYARSFSSGSLDCNSLQNKDDPGNHLSVLSDQNVQTAIWQVITGSAPDALMTLSIPPSPVLPPTPTPPPTPTDTPTPTPTATPSPTPTSIPLVLQVTPENLTVLVSGVSQPPCKPNESSYECTIVLESPSSNQNNIDWSVSASSSCVFFYTLRSGTLAPGEQVNVPVDFTCNTGDTGTITFSGASIPVTVQWTITQ